MKKVFGNMEKNKHIGLMKKSDRVGIQNVTDGAELYQMFHFLLLLSHSHKSEIHAIVR
jgi:hypothetical protein